MNIHPAELVIAIQAVQCIGSLVLAFLMLYFYRIQQRPFLCHWALSAAAVAVYLIASAAALALVFAGPSWAWLGLALSMISLCAAYLHISWLMIGTWEAIFNRSVQRKVEKICIVAALGFGLLTASIAPFDPEHALLRNILRFDLRYILTGIAFIIAAW
ncbi:MAG: hypothetical protein AAF446_02710, partial [Pseudomonadota bacterium]